MELSEIKSKEFKNNVQAEATSILKSISKLDTSNQKLVAVSSHCSQGTIISNGANSSNVLPVTGTNGITISTIASMSPTNGLSPKVTKSLLNSTILISSASKERIKNDKQIELKKTSTPLAIQPKPTLLETIISQPRVSNFKPVIMLKHNREISNKPVISLQSVGKTSIVSDEQNARASAAAIKLLPSNMMSEITTEEAAKYMRALGRTVPGTTVSYKTPGINGINKSGNVKRPMNAFMCWARNERQKLCARMPHASNADISVTLGRIWNELPDQKKLSFYEEAEAIKEQHRKEYPDWSYRPRPKRISANPKRPSLYQKWKYEQQQAKRIKLEDPSDNINSPPVQKQVPRTQTKYQPLIQPQPFIYPPPQQQPQQNKQKVFLLNNHNTGQKIISPMQYTLLTSSPASVTPSGNPNAPQLMAYLTSPKGRPPSVSVRTSPEDTLNSQAYHIKSTLNQPLMSARIEQPVINQSNQGAPTIQMNRVLANSQSLLTQPNTVTLASKNQIIKASSTQQTTNILGSTLDTKPVKMQLIISPSTNKPQVQVIQSNFQPSIVNQPIQSNFQPSIVSQTIQSNYQPSIVNQPMQSHFQPSIVTQPIQSNFQPNIVSQPSHTITKDGEEKLPPIMNLYSLIANKQKSAVSSLFKPIVNNSKELNVTKSMVNMPIQDEPLDLSVSPTNKLQTTECVTYNYIGNTNVMADTNVIFVQDQETIGQEVEEAVLNQTPQHPIFVSLPPCSTAMSHIGAGPAGDYATFCFRTVEEQGSGLKTMPNSEVEKPDIALATSHEKNIDSGSVGDESEGDLQIDTSGNDQDDDEDENDYEDSSSENSIDEENQDDQNDGLTNNSIDKRSGMEKVLPFSMYPYSDSIKDHAYSANAEGKPFPNMVAQTDVPIHTADTGSDHDEDIPKCLSFTNDFASQGWRRTSPDDKVPQLDLQRWVQYMNDSSPENITTKSSNQDKKIDNDNSPNSDKSDSTSKADSVAQNARFKAFLQEIVPSCTVHCIGGTPILWPAAAGPWPLMDSDINDNLLQNTESNLCCKHCCLSKTNHFTQVSL